MSNWDSFDISAFITSFSDEELINAANTCVDDLKDVSESDPQSEWHGECFAALLYYTQELNKRGIKLSLDLRV